jgi:hypothetical protein
MRGPAYKVRSSRGHIAVCQIAGIVVYGGNDSVEVLNCNYMELCDRWMRAPVLLDLLRREGMSRGDDHRLSVVLRYVPAGALTSASSSAAESANRF